MASSTTTIEQLFSVGCEVETLLSLRKPIPGAASGGKGWVQFTKTVSDRYMAARGDEIGMPELLANLDTNSYATWTITSDATIVAQTPGFCELYKSPVLPHTPLSRVANGPGRRLEIAHGGVVRDYSLLNITPFVMPFHPALLHTLTTFYSYSQPIAFYLPFQSKRTF